MLHNNIDWLFSLRVMYKRMVACLQFHPLCEKFPFNKSKMHKFPQTTPPDVCPCVISYLHLGGFVGCYLTSLNLGTSMGMDCTPIFDEDVWGTWRSSSQTGVLPVKQSNRVTFEQCNLIVMRVGQKSCFPLHNALALPNGDKHEKLKFHIPKVNKKTSKQNNHK